tara:strand:- start:6995 stop:8029 length:1035 start_codon:yes stop_codon:yes gene_type:complete
MLKKTVNIVGSPGWYDQEEYEGGMRGLPLVDYEVTYDKKSNNRLTIFVNKKGMEKASEVESDTKVALISDCRWVIPEYYEYFEKNHEKFDHIITYDDVMIKNFPNKVWITPAGGSFIWPKHKQKIHPKTKACSYIASTKDWNPLQVFRKGLLGYIGNTYGKFIDLYGTGHRPLKDVVGKIDGLADYAFSIAIENVESDYYFSEKLIDCFLAGTIPVYFGNRNLSKYFNMDGIICLRPAIHLVPSDFKLRGMNEHAAETWKREVFPTIDPANLIIRNKEDHGVQRSVRAFPPVDYALDSKAFLNEIVLKLNNEEYARRFEAVKENFELAKKYIDSISYAIKTHYE